MTDNTLIVGIICFIAGIASGYFGRGFIDKLVIHNQDPSRYVVFMVTTVFFISVIFDMLSAVYETSPMLYGTMGIILGYFFKVKKD